MSILLSQSQMERKKRNHMKHTGFAPMDPTPVNSSVYEALSIVPFYEAKCSDDFVKLSTIGSIPDIYQYLGAGTRPWNMKYVTTIRSQAIQDKKNENTHYLHWLVKVNDTVVGYIGIRPSIHEKRPGLQLRTFIDPAMQGRNIGTESLRKVIEVLRQMPNMTDIRLWAFVEKVNIPAVKVPLKLGFHLDGKTEFKGTPLTILYYTL